MDENIFSDGPVFSRTLIKTYFLEFSSRKDYGFWLMNFIYFNLSKPKNHISHTLFVSFLPVVNLESITYWFNILTKHQAILIHSFF